MKVIKGDILSPFPEVDAVCIPTNLEIRRDGTAVMGAGLALAAHRKWNLHKTLGGMLRFPHMHHTLVIKDVRNDGKWMAIVAIPTKDKWSEPSDIDLIKTSLDRLVKLAEHWNQIWLPSLGTGLGGLLRTLVWPIMHEKLDDRFTMVLKG